MQCEMVLNEMTIVFLCNVGGLDHGMVEVAKVVTYLHHLTWYQRCGALAPHAVLLHGPPIRQDLAGKSHGQ